VSPAGAARLLLGAALTAAVGLAAVSGPTQGAWSASVAGPSWQAATATFFTCAATVDPSLGDGTNPLFALQFRSTTSPTDVSGNGRNGVYSAPATIDTTSRSAACPRDPAGIWTLNGTSDCVVDTVSLGLLASTAFSVETWFRTTSTGTIVAYGATGLAQTPNRAVYVDTGGKVRAWIGGTDSVISTSRVDDGLWHLATVVFVPSSGTTLYVDGVASGTASSMSSAASLLSVGSWTIGCSGTAPTWPAAGAQYLRGGVRFAAVYPTSLSKTQVEQHYRAGS
jgi:hypothetical protein